MSIRWCLNSMVLLLLFPIIFACGSDGQGNLVPSAHTGDKSVRLSEIDSHSEKGDPPMTTDRRLVNPVTDVPRHVQTPVRSYAQPVRVIEEVDTLDDALTARPDGLLVPEHMVEGFSLQNIRADRETHEVVLDYRRAADADRAGLTIFMNEAGVPWGISVQEGHSEKVKVRGATEAYFIRGAWTRTPEGKVAWGTDIMVRLMLYRDDRLVTFMAFPPPEWPKERLVAVANSLEYHVSSVGEDPSGTEPPVPGAGPGMGEGHGGVSAVE